MSENLIREPGRRKGGNGSHIPPGCPGGWEQRALPGAGRRGPAAKVELGRPLLDSKSRLCTVLSAPAQHHLEVFPEPDDAESSLTSKHSVTKKLVTR